MLKLVVVGSTKVSHHGTLKTGNDDTAATSELVLIDTVLGENALLHTSGSELFTEGIFTDAADVDDRIWRESILIFLLGRVNRRSNTNIIGFFFLSFFGRRGWGVLEHRGLRFEQHLLQGI